jgi:tRNA A37 threonylcarbamoyladenosine synthetase subunit TsaC/SUA5/YrdC
MTGPSLVIRRDERDSRGNLPPGHVAEIRRILLAGGFAVVPSDTAYSVATWLRSTRTRQQLNELLRREQDEPISLAFPSAAVVRRWTEKNDAADQLLERFAPGPITVVRRASRLIPIAFTRELMGSLNHTIGVRIPDSAEERQVAGIGRSVITTVPVRNLKITGKRPVTSFDEALVSIAERSGTFEGAEWCAVEGDLRYQRTSTVVEVLGTGARCTIRRQGAISEQAIRDYLKDRQR